MKSKKCDSFNIISESVNEKIVRQYKTFTEKLGYFYKKGGTDQDLINCTYQIPFSLLSPLLNYLLQFPDRFAHSQDRFGFSVLYYAKLRPLPTSYIETLQQAGFEEKTPSGFTIEHYKDYSFYHRAEKQNTAFVFLGHDKDGAVDINAVQSLFIKGYNVLCIDARLTNIHINRVYEILNLHSNQKISLFYIGSHGAESNLKSDMHTLPIVGYSETKQIDTGIEQIEYIAENSINTATFLKGIAYASSGYIPFMVDFLLNWKLPFLPNPTPIKTVVASCNAQLAIHDIRNSLAQDSEILLLGENHKINNKQHVHHVTNLDIISMFDKLVENDSLDGNISLHDFSNAYTTSANHNTILAPYYIFIAGHTLFGDTITKEFSCLTAFEKFHTNTIRSKNLKLQAIKDFCKSDRRCINKSQASLDILTSSKEEVYELISLRNYKSNIYANMLTISCNFGHNQPDAPLEKMWTKEYLHKKYGEISTTLSETSQYCTELIYPHLFNIYDSLASYLPGSSDEKEEL